MVISGGYANGLHRPDATTPTSTWIAPMPDPGGYVERSRSVTRREVLGLLAAIPATGLAAGEWPRARHHLLVWRGWVIRPEDLTLVGSA
jgi:hypothetical protein